MHVLFNLHTDVALCTNLKEQLYSEIYEPVVYKNGHVSV